MLRAYSYLNRTQQLGRFRRVRADLLNSPLDVVSTQRSSVLFGAGTQHAEAAVRQYLLVRVAGRDFNRALLYALANHSAVTFPLPRDWQRVLIRHGFAVNRLGSTGLWAALVGLLWAYGALVAARDLAIAVGHSFRPKAHRAGPYAYFDGLTERNLPRVDGLGRSLDIFTWYARWPGRDETVRAFYHDVAGALPSSADGVPVLSASDAVPPLQGFRRALAFAAWGVGAIAISGLDALRGRWANAIMLREAVTAARARLAEDGALAAEYLFHNSRHVYRPLWTYEATRRNSRVSFYFYSTSEQFKIAAGYEHDRDEWGVMNWPRYLVWDEYQASMVRRAVPSTPEVHVVGPIWFENSVGEVPPLSRPSVAVFDIAPHRHSAHFGFSTRHDLYPDFTSVACQFLLDIHGQVAGRGAVMVHKAKRRTHVLAHPRYRAVVRSLQGTEEFVSVDPDMAAVRLIEQCDAAISAPFTSTAILAREQGKPSAYYDPDGVVAKDDRGAHGIPILSNRDELRKWLSNVLPSFSSATGPMQ